MAAAAFALVAAMIAAAPAQPESAAPQEESDGNPWIIGGTTLAITGVIAAWGYGAWWDQPTGPFHFKDTGFLNKDTYAGGADKLGHTYVCYLMTVVMTNVYEALGMSHSDAAWLSMGAVMLVSNSVELADGITEYGFEYGDVLANSLGVGLAFAGELSPFVKSTFGMRLGYVPSRDFLANDKTFIKWINDYSGMLFYFDIKPKGVIEELGGDPGWWRYVLGGVVWGTDKYSPVRVDEARRRMFGVHVGLSLPEILRAWAPNDEGIETYATFFDYYAMPFLTLTVASDLNTGEWMLNFGVSNRSQITF